jgi:type I restriction enzyme, S subunit
VIQPDTLLPPSWASAKLSDVVVLNPRFESSIIDDELLVSFVPMTAVEAGTGLINSAIARPWAEVRKGYTPFQDGDVLFAKITPCMENGKAALARGLINGFGTGSTEFFVLRPLSGIEAKFLLYFVLQEDFRRAARSKMRGNAGQLRVPKEFMETASVPVPPLPEQRRIVAEIETQFTRLDAAVAALERARTNLKRYRAAMLAGTLTGRAPSECPSSSHSDDNPMAIPMPASWSWSTLSEVSALKGGITKGNQRKLGSRLRTIPYLRVANVQRGWLDLREIKTIEATEDEIKILRLQHGDVLFNEGGDRDKLGRGWIWEDQIGECIHQNHVFRARVKSELLLPKFLSHYANAFGQPYFMREGKQTTNLASINLKKLGALPVPVPPIDEQARIVDDVERLLSVCGNMESTLIANVNRAERLRQAILRIAFAGQLVPQDLDDEPASVLLERIQAERARKTATKGSARKRLSPGQPQLF